MDKSIEHKIRTIYALDRDSCTTKLFKMDKPKLDFTREYLNGLSTERLRHILVAAYLQASKIERRAH